MLLKRAVELFGQNRRPILPALSVAHCDHTGAKVDVLDSQGDALIDPQSGAIHQLSHETRCALHETEGQLDLLCGQNDGDAVARLHRFGPPMCGD